MSNYFIPLREAINLIRSETPLKDGSEDIQIKDAIGRVTAKDYFADYDIPPFNKSAMDGFVVTNTNHSTYKIIGEIKAGDSIDKELKEQETFQIMTGAPLPPNGKIIIIKENVTKNQDIITVNKFPESDNVCYKGEDIKRGELILTHGTLLNNFAIGSLASIGVDKVKVFKKTKVSVAVTGDELVPVTQKPPIGKIRDSNSHTLQSLVNNLNFCTVNYFGHVNDSLQDTTKCIDSFLSSDDDILLFSGGSSKGEYDFIVDALQMGGFKIIFDSVQVKPGKPVVFARYGKKIIFGLPGNPVSVIVSFELFVKEAIFKNQHSIYHPTMLTAISNFDKTRRKAKRLSFEPVNLEYSKSKIVAHNVDYHGSAHINALNTIRNFMLFHIGESEIKKGDILDVRQIQ